MVGSDLYREMAIRLAAQGQLGRRQDGACDPECDRLCRVCAGAASNLSYALIENAAKKFVKPEPAAFQVAAASADWARPATSI